MPISVEGQLWGVMFVAHTGDEPLPSGTEARLAGFTELAATAIANANARMELHGFAEEQAALRRVATLVGPGGRDVFAAVTAEAGRLLNADLTAMGRYDPDRAATLVAVSDSTKGAVPALVGTRVGLTGRNVSTLVFETGQPARIDEWDDAAGPPASWHRGAAAGFTELVATAIANAEAQAALTGPRARIARLHQAGYIMLCARFIVASLYVVTALAQNHDTSGVKTSLKDTDPVDVGKVV